MTEEKIICSECGTENEPKYLYCKNCGAVIKKDNKNEGQTDNTYYGGNANYNYNALYDLVKLNNDTDVFVLNFKIRTHFR